MSYDYRISVKVEGAEDCYAVVAQPEINNPTYNLRSMFVACTGWHYEQGKWYKVSEVLPLIERGIHELTFNEKDYEKFNPSNGWGNTKSALEALKSLYECIQDQLGITGWSWNHIPIECLYVAW